MHSLLCQVLQPLRQQHAALFISNTDNTKSLSAQQVDMQVFMQHNLALLWLSLTELRILRILQQFLC